jgi:hypothetical protein
MASKKDFTITSGTTVCFSQAAAERLPCGHRDLLQRDKGKSALVLSRDLFISYKACFTHSAMAIEG